MPTMLVEIAASRCPPVSEVLLVPGCASTSATPRPARLARPYRSAVSCLGQVCGVRKLRKPCRVRNRSAGSPPVQARGLVAEKKSRTERHARKGAVYIAMRVRYVREPQRSHMRGHRLRVALHLRHRNEHAVTCWPYGSGPLHRFIFWTKESIVVHRSGTARGTLGATCATTRGRGPPRQRP